MARLLVIVLYYPFVAAMPMQLQQEGLSEDEVADLVNDRQYLEAIKQDFAKYQQELMQQHEKVQAHV